MWLPLLAKRSDFDVKRPGRSRLMGNVIHLARNIGGFAEELVWLVPVVGYAGPGCIDGSVDGYVGDVNALGPEIAGERLGEDSLSRLGRSECGIRGNAAQRRRVARPESNFHPTRSSEERAHGPGGTRMLC